MSHRRGSGALGDSTEESASSRLPHASVVFGAVVGAVAVGAVAVGAVGIGAGGGGASAGRARPTLRLRETRLCMRYAADITPPRHTSGGSPIAVVFPNRLIFRTHGIWCKISSVRYMVHDTWYMIFDTTDDT